MRPASRMIAPAQHYSWDEYPLMMTVAETAKLLRCTEKTVREMLRTGTLFGIRTGRTWRVPRDRLRHDIMIDQNEQSEIE